MDVPGQTTQGIYSVMPTFGQSSEYIPNLAPTVAQRRQVDILLCVFFKQTPGI